MCEALRVLFKDELEECFNKGMEWGEELGRKQGRRLAIAHMLRNGKTAAQIADFCGFSMEEVQKVESEMLEAAK